MYATPSANPPETVPHRGVEGHQSGRQRLENPFVDTQLVREHDVDGLPRSSCFPNLWPPHRSLADRFDTLHTTERHCEQGIHWQNPRSLVGPHSHLVYRQLDTPRSALRSPTFREEEEGLDRVGRCVCDVGADVGRRNRVSDQGEYCGISVSMIDIGTDSEPGSQFTRSSPNLAIDWTEGRSVGPLLFRVAIGMQDTLLQGYQCERLFGLPSKCF